MSLCNYSRVWGGGGGPKCPPSFLPPCTSYLWSPGVAPKKEQMTCDMLGNSPPMYPGKLESMRQIVKSPELEAVWRLVDLQGCLQQSARSWSVEGLAGIPGKSAHLPLQLKWLPALSCFFCHRINIMILDALTLTLLICSVQDLESIALTPLYVPSKSNYN